MNLTDPLRVILVEDQIAIRQDIEYLLRKQPDFIVIGACATVSDAIVLIHSTKPDLLLLDIGLPDGTGFDILEQMSPAHPKVIFLTAHSEHAVKAFRYGAIDYLLKPLNEKELGEALQRVMGAQPLLQEQINIAVESFRNNKLPDHIVLRSQQKVENVALKDICYLQGDNGCTTVFLHDGRKVVTTRILKDYEEQLSGTSFLRTHQSYLVNKSYINSYHLRAGKLELKDGRKIPVSLRKKDMVLLYFKTL